mgnify:CR=1 FL=1
MFRTRLPLVASFISAIFVASFLPANSASIAGTTCPKINSTKVVANFKYTCVKSGKKLVWNKGVSIKTTPTPSLSPKPSPTSTQPKIEIKAGDQCLGSERGSLRTSVNGTFICQHDDSEAFRWFAADPATNSINPSPTPKPTGPTSPITLDNLDPEWTSKIAYSKMLEYAKTQPKPNLEKTLILSPTVESRPYKLYMQGLEEVAQSLYSIYKNPKFTLILFTEQDSQWIDQTQTRLMGNYLINPTQQLQSYRMKESGCNVGGFYLPNILLFCVKEQSELSSSIAGNFSAAHSFPHEYFHLSQFLSTDFTNIPVLGTTASANRRFRACWIDEGFATFYGYAFGGSQIENYGEARLSFLSTLTLPYAMRRGISSDAIRNKLLLNDSNVVTALYKEVEPNLENCPDTQLAYFLGEIAGEALVASYGAKSLNDFQIEFGQSGDWKSAFQKTFSISVDDFYIKLTPYLASQAKRFPN